MPSIIPVTAPENGSVKTVISFKDPEDDTAIEPETATWTLTDLNGTIINARSVVDLTPAEDITLILSGDDLQILSTETALEYAHRLLTIEATYDTGSAVIVPITQEFLFQVENFHVLEAST